MDDLLYLSPAFDLNDLAGKLPDGNASEIGYLRLSDVAADGSESTIGEIRWEPAELTARGITLAEKAPLPDTLEAYTRAVRMDLARYLTPGRTHQVRVRVMLPKGLRALRTYTFRASRAVADGDPPVTTVPAAASSTLREADALAATPGLAALIQANSSLAKALEGGGSTLLNFLFKLEDLHAKQIARVERLLDEERVVNRELRADIGKREEAWASERSEMQKRLVDAIEAGDVPTGPEAAAKMVEQLKAAIGPLGEIVPKEALGQAVLAKVMGAPAGGRGGGPFDAVMAHVLSKVPPDQLAKLDPSAILQRLQEPAALRSFLESVGVTT